jgi:hypothetical protein
MNETEIYELTCKMLDAGGNAERCAHLVKKWAERKAEYVAAADALRDQIAEAMADGGHAEISGPRCVITYGKAGPGSVVITDEEQIAERFLTPVPASWKIDKAGIRAALLDGETVPGATLSNSRPSVAIKELGIHD